MSCIVSIVCNGCSVWKSAGEKLNRIEVNLYTSFLNEHKFKLKHPQTSLHMCDECYTELKISTSEATRTTEGSEV